ncbi:MAG TPA: c-type cytochrome domain-containing protein [Bryobacteraceae bacterium]|nr:c-type cytochrome domain-containing protein [Bryobacteraceae bacterium]
MPALLLAAASLGAQSFEGDVQPIFRRHCYGCHAANVRMGSLDIQTIEGLRRGGNQGPVLVPGKAAESRLYLTLTGAMKPDMPMGGQPLAATDLQTIRSWIDGGARPDQAAARNAANTLLATASGPLITLRDAVSGRVLHQLKGHTGPVVALHFPADGGILASVSSDGVGKLWDVRNGRCLRTVGGQ